jgi:hypothetical protein
VLTAIYLCHTCSYHEIEDGNGPDRAEALLIWFGGLDSEHTDAVASLIVSGTILVGCLMAFVAWVRQVIRYSQTHRLRNGDQAVLELKALRRGGAQAGVEAYA